VLGFTNEYRGVGRAAIGRIGYKSEEAFLIFPSAISLKATTTSRLSELISGFAPLKSCLARFDASMTNSKRFETLRRQSSTVIRDMFDSSLVDNQIQTDFSNAVNLTQK
jgi:hypothetical protein